MDGANERRARERRGRVGEWLAAVMLLAKGYRILARRVRTPVGEIDLIAVRGRRLAFVEVKRRRDIETAQSAVSRRQARRVAQAAEHWVWRHPIYRTHELGLDCIFVVPGKLPHHAINALQPL